MCVFISVRSSSLTNPAGGAGGRHTAGPVSTVPEAEGPRPRDALCRGLAWWGAGSPLEPLLPGPQPHSGGPHPGPHRLTPPRRGSGSNERVWNARTLSPELSVFLGLEQQMTFSRTGTQSPLSVPTWLQTRRLRGGRAPLGGQWGRVREGVFLHRGLSEPVRPAGTALHSPRTAHRPTLRLEQSGKAAWRSWPSWPSSVAADRDSQAPAWACTPLPASLGRPPCRGGRDGCTPEPCPSDRPWTLHFVCLMNPPMFKKEINFTFPSKQLLEKLLMNPVKPN